MKGLCHLMGQFQGGVVFPLFKKQYCFPSHTHHFCQFLLRQIVSGSEFLYTGFHFNFPFWTNKDRSQ